ncbi:MAG: flavodoxin [Clostridia bacterium]|nr:flavodoxin [Clostridia bacterium]
MKKLIAVLMTLCLLCGVATAEAAPRILIAYVSRAGENYNVGVADPDSVSAAYAGYIEKGNTEIVAETIAELTGGDLYHITTVEPYPDDYASMLTRAQEELDADARPALAGELPNLDDYDIIMIGYPIWHGATPRPVLTFLESYDLSGKKLVPFNTHEGSGQSGTVREIEASAPDAEMLDGIAIQGKTAQEDADKTRALLADWLGGIGLK